MKALSLRQAAPLAGVAAAATVGLVPAVARWFEYDRVRIASGEYWRLVTGHLAHVSFEHFAWDVAAFVVAGIVCARLAPSLAWKTIAASAAAVPAALWALSPELELYRGLSGIDSALFAAAAVWIGAEAVARRDRVEAGLVGLAGGGFVAKIGYEWIVGDPFFLGGSSGMVAVPLAHGVGALTGLAVAIAGRNALDAEKGSTPECLFPEAPVKHNEGRHEGNAEPKLDRPPAGSLDLLTRLR